MSTARRSPLSPPPPQCRPLRLVCFSLLLLQLLTHRYSCHAFSFITRSYVQPLQGQQRPLSRTTHTHPHTRKAVLMSALASADQELGAALEAAGVGASKLDLKGVFATLTSPGSRFMETYWQRQPCYTTTSIPSLKGGWTMTDMEEAVAKEFLLAGRGFFDEEKKGGWKMATVGQPRGSSFEDAKLRPEDVRQAMAKRSGTVVFNSVGASVAPLAGVCLDAVESFRLPVALNLYLTAPGQATSAPPHTDKQDVFVLQSQGRKRWRVYAPPVPAKKPEVCPFARGKDSDILSLDEMGPPLIDMVLGPGQMLYMPAGFPHTTDTVVGMSDEKDPSVHLTLGVDTHIWGLTHATLRDYLLFRLDPTASTIPPPPTSTQTEVDKFVRYNGQLPLGAREATPAAGASPRWSDMKKVLGEGIEKEFRAVMQEVDPQTLARLEETPEGEQVLKEVIDRVIDHHRVVTAIFRDMYSDVKYGLTDVLRDLSFFRSQPYFQKIELTMQKLVDWAAPPLLAAGAGVAAAVAWGSPMPVSLEGGGGGGGGNSKGGFGSSKKQASSGKGGGKKKK